MNSKRIKNILNENDLEYYHVKGDAANDNYQIGEEVITEEELNERKAFESALLSRVIEGGVSVYKKLKRSKKS